jgi:hypothetical protein
MARDLEKKKATDKAWRLRNRERISATGKAWRLRNCERKRETDKAWYNRTIGSYTEKSRKRRARKMNAKISLTAKEKEKLRVLELTRRELQTETGMIYHLDHIIPLAHGGLHHPINLRILGIMENSMKKDKLLPEAIALAPEHFRLYSERVSPERAWEFVRQLAAGLGLSEKDLDALITGKPLKNKPTLEDFML